LVCCLEEGGRGRKRERERERAGRRDVDG
jgi:hypothetical protein